MDVTLRLPILASELRHRISCRLAYAPLWIGQCRNKASQDVQVSAFASFIAASLRLLSPLDDRAFHSAFVFHRTRELEACKALSFLAWVSALNRAR